MAINKANIKPVPEERYIITSSDVVKYLQDQLGFTIASDFTRWTGVSEDRSYVRMRVVFNPVDIIARNTSTDYVDRILSENAAGIRFKDSVIDTIRPFMYPSTVGDLANHPDDLNRLFQIGLYNERLSEIIKYSKLNYCRESNVFLLYLRPERIIVDMLADPSTNKIDGDLSIIAVHGTTSETIRWDVSVTKNKNSFGTTDISIDALFNNRQ